MAATPVLQSFEVTAAPVVKTNQTISFGALTDRTYGTAPFALTAIASSGLPVSFRIAAGPATVSGGSISLTGTGQVTVEATQSGNTSYNAAPPVTQSFQVLKGAQTISFAPLASRTFGEPPFALSAMASSGLPVSFRIVSGPATLSGNTLTLTGTGTVTVEAVQAGDGLYGAAAPVTQSFAVTASSTTKLAQTISFGTLAYKTYTSPPFAVAATSTSGLPVAFRVVSGPVTISGNMVTITGVGNVTIEASQSGNTAYNAAVPVQRSFTVGKAGQSISFPTLTNRLLGSAPFTLTATATSGLPVSYRVVSGPATVSGSIVTLTGVGTVMIEATQTGNTFYTAAAAINRQFAVQAATTSTSIAPVPFTAGTTAGAVSNELVVFPNPASSRAFFRVTLVKNTTGTVAIHDGSGKLVRQLGQYSFKAGAPFVLDWDVTGISAGTYHVSISKPGGTLRQRLQVVK